MPAPSMPSINVNLGDDDEKWKIWYGYLTAADNTWRPSLTIAATNGSIITNNGVTLITSTANTTHFLAPPEPGVSKRIVYVTSSTANKVNVVTTSTAITIGSSDTVGWKLTFGSSVTYKAIDICGIKTTQYVVMSNQGSVLLTTT